MSATHPADIEMQANQQYCISSVNSQQYNISSVHSVWDISVLENVQLSKLDWSHKDKDKDKD